jgi:uncharacterized protein YndB with AHSA1/START domain
LIRASPERIFEVFDDARAYANWVVGSDTIRDSDPDWPAVGSRFHHRVGVGLIKVNDHTQVVKRNPPRELVLHARARPMGTAKVSMRLEPVEGGTCVTMEETPGDPLSHLAINPLTYWLVRLRNEQSLRRLARIAEAGPVTA